MEDVPIRTVWLAGTAQKVRSRAEGIAAIAVAASRPSTSCQELELQTLRHDIPKAWCSQAASPTSELPKLLLDAAESWHPSLSLACGLVRGQKGLDEAVPAPSRMVLREDLQKAR